MQSFDDIISLIPNISLGQLADMEKFSVRTINVCKNNGLISLHDILTYYDQYQTFLNFQACGVKTEKELVKLSLKYINRKYEEGSQHTNFYNLLEQIPNIPLWQVANKENLSVRAINICQDNNLNYLHNILIYHYQHQKFRKLQSCGAKTERELIELCLRCLDNEIDWNLFIQEQEIKQDELTKIKELSFTHLNKIQRHILEQYFINRIQSLSQRTINCLSNIIGNSVDFQTFFKAVSKSNFTIKDLRNAGKKTEEEFTEFYHDIFILTNIFCSEISDEEVFRHFVSIVERNLGVPEDFLNKYKADFFDKSFPLFLFIDFLIEQGYIFSGRDLFIFYHRFNYCADKEILVLEEIGEKLESDKEKSKLSRERVRQIAEKINSAFQGKLSHLFICFPYTNYSINLQEDEDVISVSNDFADSINMLENVNFTPKFYTKIFSVFLGDSHILFLENIRDNTNIYLIKKELFNYFDFGAFYEDIEKKVNEKIKSSYLLHFEGYLYGFLKDNEISILNRIKPICERILIEDFNLLEDLDGNLKFERNTKITREEYALEILEECGYPMHINELYDNIEKKYPGIILNSKTLQSALQRDNQFIFFGRSSTYGLKKWEDEDDSIKGGTIKNIVEEYLQQFDEPKHISEISLYLDKYRATTEQNILGNLKINNQRFIFFYGGFVGLKDKQYINVENFKELVPIKIKKVSEEDLVVEYYNLKTKLGRVPTSIEMKELGKCSISAYYTKFGGWNNFLESIGEPFTIVNKKISEENLIAAYYELKENLGCTPTTIEMNKLGKYNVKIYYKRFGTWNQFLESIGEDVKRNTISEEELTDAFYELKDYLGHTPKTKEIDEFGKYSLSSYYAKFGSWNKFLESIGEDVKWKTIRSRTSSKGLSEEDLINAFYELKEEVGHIPTSTEMREIGKYSLTAYDNRFGTWNKFLESIGEATKDKSIPDEKLIAAYHELKDKLGRIPTSMEMNKFGKYSYSVYYTRFGGWNNFLESIGEI